MTIAKNQRLIIDDPACYLDRFELVGVTGSHLGHDLGVQRSACRFLSRSLLDTRSDAGRVVAVATGSAIEPWAVRASELYGVPLVRLCVDPACQDERKPSCDAAIHILSLDGQKLDRDQILASLANRIDAVWVRAGGRIEQSITDRIDRSPDTIVRVAVTEHPRCAGAKLITRGAIGWYQPSCQPPYLWDPKSKTDSASDAVWLPSDSSAFLGDWLFHCTRARRGPWPGETTDQYRDAMILGNEQAVRRDALDSLARIVRSDRLVCSAIVSSAKYPVVCFAKLPLEQLLARRCYRPHLGRWDYEPFGIAIRFEAAKQFGIRPVIYDAPENRTSLSPADQYRFHPIGKTFHWQEENEWRSCRDVVLSELAGDSVRVFCPDTGQARQRLAGCPHPICWLTSR